MIVEFSSAITSGTVCIVVWKFRFVVLRRSGEQVCLIVCSLRVWSRPGSASRILVAMWSLCRIAAGGLRCLLPFWRLRSVERVCCGVTRRAWTMSLR